MEATAEAATSRRATRLPASLDVRTRRMNFDIDKAPYYAYPEDPARSHILYALSLLFPEGERFFMDSVINYKDRIQNPELKSQIKGFLGQEGQHSAEHRKYNDRIARGRIRTTWIERLLGKGLGLLRRIAPKKHQLAVTCALEHFTAILANELLSDPRYAEGMDPTHEALWKWHAVEETEHKAVAYEVYEEVASGFLGYLRRAIVMLITSAAFLAVAVGVTGYLLLADGQLHKPVTWRSLGRFLFTNPGVVPNVWRQYWDYYRRDFHPWDHDNAALVAAWKLHYAAV